MLTFSSLSFFALLRILFDKKTEPGAEERIPIFFFESLPLRAVIASDKTKISSTSKTCDMSDISVINQACPNP
jgi:hypothetical protein